MPYLDRQGVSIDGQDYPLYELADDSGRPKRLWRETLKPVAVQREPRPHVRAGQVESEWVATYDNWNLGVGGELENDPGLIHNLGGSASLGGGGLHGLIPGALRPAAGWGGGGSSGDEEADPCWVGLFNGELFEVKGRRVLRYNAAGGGATEDVDFGAGVRATDAIVHNNELVVGFAGSTNTVRTRNTSGTWTTATDAVYAAHFTHAEDRLWRDTSTNQVSNIGPTDGPRTLANWSAGITVGDASIGVTDLNTYGVQIVVSKPNGAYLGNRDAIFDNIFPQLENTPDADNGKQTLIRGADIFFPHQYGLLRYDGASNEEVGLPRHLRNATTADALLGLKIKCLAAQGEFLWSAADHPIFPRARATRVQVTADSGVNYTSYDTSTGVAVSLNSLDTLANGDWFIVGYSSIFYGIVLEITNPNGNAATLTAEFWNGSAWVSAGPTFFDGTAKPLLSTPMVAGTTTLRRSGHLTWATTGQVGTWTASTINTVNAFWMRFTVSAALDAAVTINDVWVSSTGAVMQGSVYRGRTGERGDVRNTSVIWEPYSVYNTLERPSVVNYVTDVYPFARGGILVISSRQTTVYIPVPINDLEEMEPFFSSGMSCVLPRDDFGMPTLNKQFLSITQKGRSIGVAPRSMRVNYRVNQATAFTTGATITTSPTVSALAAVTGYSLQLQVENVASGTTLTAASQQNEIFPEMNTIEVMFRELNSYNREWELSLILPPGGDTPPDTMLTNLEALVGVAAVSFIDPLRRSYTASVAEVGPAVELYRAEDGWPALMVPIRVVET